MTDYAIDLWGRAQDALSVARREVTASHDAAASRAYYAAFYAVSALFALRGLTFTRHAAVEVAVHRDLVRPGLVTAEFGQMYSHLAQLRMTGDYGGSQHVSAEGAKEAVDMAGRIVQMIHEQDPAALPPPSW